MVGPISEEQVAAWLDGTVVDDLRHVSDEGTEFTIRLRLAHQPIRIVKEETLGPIRLVSDTAFDTEGTQTLLESEEHRTELLTRIGPALAATPGFYTLLDAEGASCEFADARSIRLEHRIYPDGANRQAVMEGLMALASAAQYLQNTVAVLLDAGRDG
ncbi:hypothetical protein ZOD2009_19833 [Haladaptatus paucihalophilus DX253]|uniref:Uncharacterized protein n=1 Tax=Haladaptatus paucihalophilus DX253 TaxID=797209 RepID=E7QYS6_HALPU|nr:hypothetical protein [Haladaptatus paucihalophilus]EFW90342.1 hypothetical protein ZOD2009_19833 [Haladaptatus paucihalophilus DX253]SHK01731.1 hypothetical protein SAMN05444342_0291 [Haladaptatus paucihalophilus DX253]